jgi:hypothetical protein
VEYRKIPCPCRESNPGLPACSPAPYATVKNFKMDRKEIGYEDVDWIHLARDGDQWHALVNNNRTFVSYRGQRIS